MILRTIRRLLRREVLWHGNRESLVRSLFTRESVVWWAITTHACRRSEFSRLRRSNEYPRLRWYEFTLPAEIDRFIATASCESVARLRSTLPARARGR